MESGYLDINGVKMYYEVHGHGEPLVLLHGAFSAIGSSFGALIPGLSKDRKVIGFDLQAHGRTADIDRPLRLETLADDVAVAIGELGLAKADVLGYSNGGAVALHLTLRHPDLIRKLIVMSVGYQLAGIHPGLMEGLGEMTSEMMHGSPWHDEYLSIAPRPEDFPILFAKKTEMDRATRDITDDEIRNITAPVLLIAGDSDLITPEHAVAFFRLLGGGVFGDMPPGLPDSQLAIIPGASHVGVASRIELLVPIISSFLEAPMPAEKA
jgi:pimeloyl-ACP methyl ester carboxylesterase